ncbi:MAG TPA: DUF433 domain-containing protein [Gemmataceae bacterium]|nr:DUF433 domain-containing protein [Gemmataceae bacterium]
MTTTIEPLVVPLRLDEHGTYRVGDTRIPLERVIEAYLDGNPPAAIVQSFPDLRLVDVFAVITYYLAHTGAIDDYLRRQEQAAGETLRRLQAAQPPQPTRAELLARRQRRDE